jgi:ArsR family transcriptional regulator
MARSTDPDVALLQALADPTRLGIVRQLATENEVCACDFTACCEVAQPTVSHHLRVLREAGIVSGERRRSWVFYRLTPSAVDRLESLVGSLRPARGAVLPVIQPGA